MAQVQNPFRSVSPYSVHTLSLPPTRLGAVRRACRVRLGSPAGLGAAGSACLQWAPWPLGLLPVWLRGCSAWWEHQGQDVWHVGGSAVLPSVSWSCVLLTAALSAKAQALGSPASSRVTTSPPSAPKALTMVP